MSGVHFALGLVVGGLLFWVGSVVLALLLHGAFDRWGWLDSDL